MWLLPSPRLDFDTQVLEWQVQGFVDWQEDNIWVNECMPKLNAILNDKQNIKTHNFAPTLLHCALFHFNGIRPGRKKPLMADFNETLSNICTAACIGNTQHSTHHSPKIVYLTIFICNCLKAQDWNYSSVSLPGVCSFHISHIVTKLRNKSLLCQNSVKYF